MRTSHVYLYSLTEAKHRPNIPLKDYICMALSNGRIRFIYICQRIRGGGRLFKSIKRVSDYAPLRVSAGINRQCYIGAMPSWTYEVTGSISLLDKRYRPIRTDTGHRLVHSIVRSAHFPLEFLILLIGNSVDTISLSLEKRHSNNLRRRVIYIFEDFSIIVCNRSL